MDAHDQNYLCTREGQVVGPFTRDQLADMKRTGAIQAYFWVWDASNPQWAPAAAPPPPPAAPSPIAAQPMEAKTAELNIHEEPTMGGTSTVVMPSQPARQYARFDNRSEFSTTSNSSTTEVTSEHYIPPASFGFDDDEATELDTPRTIPDRPARKSPRRSQMSHETTQEVRGITVVAHNRRSVINGQLRQPTSVGAMLVGPAPRDRMSGPFVRGSRIWINLLDVRSGKSENVEAQVTSTMRRGSVWEYRVKWDKVPTILEAA
jgi:hypothetical protein